MTWGKKMEWQEKSSKAPKFKSLYNPTPLERERRLKSGD